MTQRTRMSGRPLRAAAALTCIGLLAVGLALTTPQPTHADWGPNDTVSTDTTGGMNSTSPPGNDGDQLLATQPTTSESEDSSYDLLLLAWRLLY